jgi:hypothetical protein
LISSIIATRLSAEGLPVEIDPFASPPTPMILVAQDDESERETRERLLAEVMSTEDVSA